MSIIRTENLTRKFGALTAADHLNLEIAEGEIFGLVGPDGAGKTDRRIAEISRAGRSLRTALSA